MNWHVILHAGANDTYTKEFAPDAPRMFVSLDRGGDLFVVRQNVVREIHERFGRVPPPLALDLLTAAMGVFAADLRIPRAFAEDRWGRQITLHVPVFNLPVWGSLASKMAEMLKFLTGDSWELEFRERAPLTDLKEVPPNGSPVVRDVALFSGGLDSLAGAIDLLELGQPVALVGHYGAGVTNSVQRDVLSGVQENYSGLVIPCMFHVQPVKNREVDGDDRRDEGEQSMRSRSLLFLSLGVAVASALGPDSRLIISENGLISLNVPLTNPRIGSCSTRTTHPHFIGLFRELLQALSLQVQLELPGRFRTKGEMLREVRNQELLRKVTARSMSCSHPEQGRYRKLTPGNHCGYCVPCIVRRAAMVAASLPDAAYDTDLLNPDVEVSGETRKDLRAFEIAVQRLRGVPRSQILFDVLSTGPLLPEDAAAYADVYRRGMEEIARFLSLRGRRDST